MSINKKYELVRILKVYIYTLFILIHSLILLIIKFICMLFNEKN